MNKNFNNAKYDENKILIAISVNLKANDAKDLKIFK